MRSGRFWKNFFKWGCFAAYVLCIAFLVMQGLTPGAESSKESTAFGDTVNDAITDIVGSITQQVDVTGVSITSPADGDEIKAGDTVRIKCEVRPDSATNSAVVYTAEDEEGSNVLRVSATGVITALHPGKAVIKATSEENPALYDAVRITVVPVPATSVSITGLDDDEMDGDCYIMYESVSYTLGVAYKPAKTTDDKAVDWTSSDTDVLTVSDGMVTAIAEGEATITVTNRANPSLTCSVQVKVLPQKADRVPLESMDVGPATRAIKVNEFFYITPVFTPEDATFKEVNYVSSDPSVVLVKDDGIVKGLAKGTAEVTVYSTHDDVSVKITVTVSENAGSIVGLAVGKTQIENGGRFTAKTSASFKFDVKFEPKPSVYNYTYATSDDKVAEISEDGTVVPRRTGSCTITVVNEADGETTSLSFTLVVEATTIKDVLGNFYYIIRKTFGHFLAFFGMGIFGALTYLLFSPKGGKFKVLAFMLSVMSGFIIAGVTELCQLSVFTAGRYCSFSDVLLDSYGFIASTVIVYLIAAIWAIIDRLSRAEQPAPEPQDTPKRRCARGEETARADGKAGYLPVDENPQTGEKCPESHKNA